MTPLRRIAGAARRMQRGTLDVRVDERGLGEVCELAQSFNAMAQSLERGRDDLEHQNAELEAQGNQLAETVTALALEEERIERFHGFVEALASEPELDRLGPLVLDRLVEAAGAGSGTLYVLDPAEPTGDLHLAAARGVDAPAPTVPAVLPADGGAVHLPLRAGGLMIALATLDPPTITRPSSAWPAPPRSRSPTRSRSRSPVARPTSTARCSRRPTTPTRRSTPTCGSPPGRRRRRRRPATRRARCSAAGSTSCSSRRAGAPATRPRTGRCWPTRRRAARARAATSCRSSTDGRELRIELSSSPLKVGERWTVNGFMRDITERRARERAREAQRAVSLAIAEADAQEDVMPRVLEALGRELRRPLAVHWVPENGGMRRAAVWRDPALPAGALPEAVLSDPAALPLRACREGRPASEDSALALPITCGPDGLGVLELWDRRAGAPDPELADALLAIAALIAEVLERRRAEAEAERLKNEFFALVSHELRTPLTSIIGYLELILEEEAGEVDPEQRRFLGVIERNARRLLRLVGDLLFVAQFEAGQLSLERGTVDLQAVTVEAVEAARPRAHRVGVELEAQADPLPPLDGDRDRLGQVVDNLVSNALKFTPAGGRVTVRAGGPTSPCST